MDPNIALFFAIYNSFNSEAANLFFNLITWAGNVFFWAAVGFVLVLKQRKKPAVDLLVASLFVVLFVQALKWDMMVARPFDALPGVSSLVYGPLENDPSFPSGHSAIAAMGAVVLGCYYPRRKIPLAVLASLVMLSRIYLGVHFPVDVLMGAMIGAAVGWLVVKWKADNRFMEKVVRTIRLEF